MKRLVLNQHDRKISGLCAGIADYLGIDVTVVRLVTLLLTVLTGILPGILIYFVAVIITPKEGATDAQA